MKSILLISLPTLITSIDFSLVKQFSSNQEEIIGHQILDQYEHHRTRRQIGGLVGITCRDSFQNCANAKNFCTLDAYKERFREICKVTCGVCDPEAELAGDSVLKATEETSILETAQSESVNVTSSDNNSSQPIPVEGEVCQDLLSDCSVIKVLCPTGAGNSHYHCRKTCGLCDQDVQVTTTISPLMTTPGSEIAIGSNINIENPGDPNCVDKLGERCKLWVPLCTQPDEAKRKVFVLQCQKTCGLCDFNSAKDLNKPTLPPIIYNKETGTGEIQTTTDCKDNYPGCRATTTLMCETSEAVRVNCPMRCGVCQMAPEQQKEAFDEKKCKDMSSTVCATMKQYCQDPGYTKNLQMMCPVTCGMDCFSKDDLASMIGKPEVVNTVMPASAGQMTQPTTPSILNNQQTDSASSAEKPCKDYNSNCKFMKTMCGSRPKISDMCPVTCGKCEGASEVSAVVTTRAPPSEENCYDKLPGCNSMKNFCETTTYKKQMTENCAKTCGVCGKTPDFKPPKKEEVPCKDFHPQCTSDVYKNNCHMAGIQKICRVSCNQCSDEPEVEITTTETPTSTCTDDPSCKLISSMSYCERSITRERCPNLCNTCTTPVAFSTEAAAQPIIPTPASPSETVVSVQPAEPVQPVQPITVAAVTQAPVTEASITSATSIVVSTQTPASTCRDTSANCPQDWCRMPGPKKQAHVRAYCKNTCGFCRQPGVAASAASGPSVTASQPTCKDRSTSIGCPKEYCTMPGPKKVAHVRANCKATCGFCPKNPTTTSTTSAVSSSTVCADKKPNYCNNYMRNKCHVASLQAALKAECAKTCGFCGSSSGTSSSSASSGSMTTSACRDKMPAKCKSFKSKCQHAQYKSYMKINCKETCGYCGASSAATGASTSPTKSPVTTGTCKDKLGKCTTLPKSYCSMGKTKAYMTQNCKARCGLCPAASSGMATKQPVANSGACTDAKPKYCQSLGQMRCSTGKYGGTMKMYCKATCGLC